MHRTRKAADVFVLLVGRRLQANFHRDRTAISCPTGAIALTFFQTSGVHLHVYAVLCTADSYCEGRDSRPENLGYRHSANWSLKSNVGRITVMFINANNAVTLKQMEKKMNQLQRWNMWNYNRLDVERKMQIHIHVLLHKNCFQIWNENPSL